MPRITLITTVLIGLCVNTVAIAGAQGSQRLSPLRQAIDTNDVNVVTRALDSGADANAYDEYALTPLVRAVIGGNQSIVLELLRRGANPNPPRAARSPLEVALARVVGQRVVCDLPMVRLLLANGSDPNHVFPSLGERPLQRALELGDPDCVNVFLYYGADPSVYSTRGKPALQAATDGASQTGNMALVNLILSLGADVNGPPGRRGSPLVEATALNNVDVVRLLISKGADPCLAEHGKPNAWDIARALNRTDLQKLMAPHSCKSS